MMRRRNNLTCNLFVQRARGTSFLFIYFPHLLGVNDKRCTHVLYHEIGLVIVEQAVDARESSWKWAHLSIPVVDGELGKLVLAKARGFCKTKDREGLCVRKVL